MKEIRRVACESYCNEKYYEFERDAYDVHKKGRKKEGNSTHFAQFINHLAGYKI